MTMLKGLNLLLNYNRITGNTFFGWINHGQSKKKQIIFRIWNICLLNTLSVNCYFWIQLSLFNAENVAHSSVRNSSFSILHFLFTTTNIMYSIQALLIGVFILIFGRQMMTLLAQDSGVETNPIKEYSTAKLIVTIQLSYASLLSSIRSINDINYYETSFVIGMHITNIISISTQVTILALIAYKALLVKHHYDNVDQLNLTYNLDVIYCSVFKTDKSVKSLDKYFSIYILVFLLFNQVFCVSHLCQMALNSQIRFYESLLCFVYTLINISILCIVCCLIPSSLSTLLDRLENHMNEHINKYDTKNRQILMQMRQMSDRIGFTAFGVFRVNSSTFLSCLALIISYSVIIIQTVQPSATDTADTFTNTSNNTNCSCPDRKSVV